MTQVKVRPTGVTAIAVLDIIQGVVMLAWGLAFSALTAFLAFIPFLGPIAIAVSAVTVGLGIAYFVLAWATLKAKPWAWTLNLVISILSIIVSLLSFDIIVLVIAAVILYYLTRNHVKVYFGKEAQTA